ncbi:hypothetical protein FB451DRAFT_1409486 [Mycena latifolia]|nr:hypothetical protein FB451DRAFT_1411130 [Mycena latifolia]KAJ7452337.1 hypothetical protein FB451DRAFT_1409486 [Mycena latifolia]
MCSDLEKGEHYSYEYGVFYDLLLAIDWGFVLHRRAHDDNPAGAAQAEYDEEIPELVPCGDEPICCRHCSTCFPPRAKL